MAEVATSVLHNVGNVLNSINVSAAVVGDRLRRSTMNNLGRVVALIKEHPNDLGRFITEDPKGRLLPSYLEQLSENSATEIAGLLEEVSSLSLNLEHVKEIVAMQQNYVKVAGVTEKVTPVNLVEDALRLNAASLTRHAVTVVREYESVLPELCLEKHKALQILVNLVQNAKGACNESARPDKQLRIAVEAKGDKLRISMTDNGVGIPKDNLTRIFNQGFTTRKKGHGFGLHSGALAAKELGGSLHAHSEGLGHGATFTLELPLTPPASNGQHK